MNKETNIDYTCWGHNELIERIEELEALTFSKPELKALAYHTEYDMNTIAVNHNWADLGQNEAISTTALLKVKKLLKQ